MYSTIHVSNQPWAKIRTPAPVSLHLPQRRGEWYGGGIYPAHLTAPFALALSRKIGRLKQQRHGRHSTKSEGAGSTSEQRPPKSEPGFRRRSLGAYAAVAGTARQAKAYIKDWRPFPPGFQWGVATAAFQIEGATSEEGRGPSIWDTFSHVPGNISQDATADVACDHFHRCKEDVQLIKKLGCC